MKQDHKRGIVMPCSFLVEKTYTTRKGRMVKHYCKARGLMDTLNKETWKHICLKDAFCIIRQQAEERLRTEKVKAKCKKCGVVLNSVEELDARQLCHTCAEKELAAMVKPRTVGEEAIDLKKEALHSRAISKHEL